MYLLRDLKEASFLDEVLLFSIYEHRHNKPATSLAGGSELL